ncbi:hypothetical protein UY3_17201 [Chelonia mydas]|uniref:Uncharacterized protein n=1 Tax=Chelonia mydas TaxID=8469 RepID=M7AS52_CHEMY|nr:hypothetical protein UY3_17201 [Chelonia mydas]
MVGDCAGTWTFCSAICYIELSPPPTPRSPNKTTTEEQSPGSPTSVQAVLEMETDGPSWLAYPWSGTGVVRSPEICPSFVGRHISSVATLNASGIDGGYMSTRWSGDRGGFGLDWIPARAEVNETLGGSKAEVVCPEPLADSAGPLGFKGGDRSLTGLVFFPGTRDGEQCRTEANALWPE